MYPGLEDAHEQFIDTFDEMEGQLDKEMERAKELRKKVDDDPGKLHDLSVLRPSADNHRF